MEFLTNLIGNEAVFNLVLLIVGSVWSFIRASEWWQDKKQNNEWEVFKLIDASIEMAYNQYVRDAKLKNDPENGSPLGKLSEVERETAREIAYNKFVELAKAEGREDVLKNFTKEHIIALISKNAKQNSGNDIPTN